MSYPTRRVRKRLAEAYELLESATDGMEITVLRARVQALEEGLLGRAGNAMESGGRGLKSADRALGKKFDQMKHPRSRRGEFVVGMRQTRGVDVHTISYKGKEVYADPDQKAVGRVADELHAGGPTTEAVVRGEHMTPGKGMQNAWLYKDKPHTHEQFLDDYLSSNGGMTASLKQINMFENERGPVVESLRAVGHHALADELSKAKLDARSNLDEDLSTRLKKAVGRRPS